MDATFESKYGTQRPDLFRKSIVTNFLKRGIPVTVAEDDLINLHGWNTFGPQWGDEAIHRKVTFWKRILRNTYGDEIPESEYFLLLSRKGDETYACFPGRTSDEVQQIVNDYINNHKDEVDALLTINITQTDTTSITRKARSYWKTITSSNQDEFDQAFPLLESSIEEAKIAVVQEVIDSILKKNPLSSTDVVGLISAYLIDDKRTPETAVRMLIEHIGNEFKRAVGEGTNVDDVISGIKKLLSNQKYRLEIQNVVDMIVESKDDVFHSI